MVSESLSERIAAAILRIPTGTVATYGQVAAMAGNARAARQVSRVLRMWSSARDLPWHRVVGSGGWIRLPPGSGGEEQAYLLAEEGVEVDSAGRINLERFGFRPETPR